ncbi:glycosyltransferase family 2 protein [Paenibacillus sp. MER TA 81-3]|uniref:glycosyltransferase family 2 protein n=1 Tax=Paenibacillus sp. MER TA 81-3 TaxID=2939573 RepID=UPI00203ED0DD|nr:glycosyltransferase family 2 protein [Paenibacillus sp. MER TA 81-3]MCM3338822.1 glycosyltransferase family 2 protein [Paenibacillus sp. MER TA 81-3]
MINFDIILVSYNSEKWILKCLSSLEKIQYPLSKVHITIIDNNSSDKSTELIKNYPNKNLFGSYQFHLLETNLGFGKANNYAVNRTEQDYIFFLNIDTEVVEDCFTELWNAIERSNQNIGLWECRQFPYEHPKVYNPVTLEVSWASAAACVVRRDCFEKVGMFDENIFMYAEDVDLSWRLRAYGYKLQYVPKSVVYHFTYLSAGEVKPNQFYNSTYNNVMLRFKFGSWKDIFAGYALYKTLFFVKGPDNHHKRRILVNLFKSFSEGMKFRRWRRKNSSLNFKPNFQIWDYEIVRDGAFYLNEKQSNNSLVSILVRTCGRPNVLRESLISIRNQTYKNIEVVIIEDGPNISEKMIKSEFNDLNYIYYSTEEKVGRCVAGNIALEKSNGEYLNFLDDDDLLYSDHIEVLINELRKNTSFQAAYSLAFEVPTKVESRNPYKYKELFHNVQHRQNFNRLVLLHHNYFPIQTVLFKKSIYKELGGFNPELEVLEDWDLWLRYALKYDFYYVEKLTSLYRVPAELSIASDRQKLFDKYLTIVRENHFNNMSLTNRQIFKDFESHYKSNPVQSIVFKSSVKILLHKVLKKIYMKMKR